MSFEFKKLQSLCNNKPTKSIKSNSDIKKFIFCSKYVFIYFVMSFFLITRGDGLVVKALECCQKDCEFKPYLEHS